MSFNKILLTAVYLVVAYLLAFCVQKILKLLIFGVEKAKNQRLLKKTRTIKSFVDSVIYIISFTVVLILILDFWGINTMPLLTGAGIAGLAISFGSQSLVKDIISGIFILLENQFDVGDYIKVDKLEGKVIKISLRQTVLKDDKENLIYLPNSQITTLIKLKK